MVRRVPATRLAYVARVEPEAGEGDTRQDKGTGRSRAIGPYIVVVCGRIIARSQTKIAIMLDILLLE